MYSKHPLTDTTVYPDDIVMHGTDAKGCHYYRRFDSLGAGVTSRNVSECAEDYVGYPCVFEKYGFGWAVTGLETGSKGQSALPVSLDVDGDSEPDLRRGESPIGLKGTVTVSGLSNGKEYALYRWNSAAEAFASWGTDNLVHTWSQQQEKKQGQDDSTTSSYVWKDPSPIHSSSATYYACVPTHAN